MQIAKTGLVIIESHPKKVKRPPVAVKVAEVVVADVADKFDDRQKPRQCSNWFLSMRSNLIPSRVLTANLVLSLSAMSQGDRALYGGGSGSAG